MRNRTVSVWAIPCCYSQAADRLNNRQACTVAGNTVLIRTGNAIECRLHGSLIATFRFGLVHLYDGGHRSMLTLRRLNALAPYGVRINRNGGHWTVTITDMDGETRTEDFVSGRAYSARLNGEADDAI